MVEIACVALVSMPSGDAATVESGQRGMSCDAIPELERSGGAVWNRSVLARLRDGESTDSRTDSSLSRTDITPISLQYADHEHLLLLHTR